MKQKIHRARSHFTSPHCVLHAKYQNLVDIPPLSEADRRLYHPPLIPTSIPVLKLYKVTENLCVFGWGNPGSLGITSVAILSSSIRNCKCRSTCISLYVTSLMGYRTRYKDKRKILPHPYGILQGEYLLDIDNYTASST